MTPRFPRAWRRARSHALKRLTALLFSLAIGASRAAFGQGEGKSLEQCFQAAIARSETISAQEQQVLQAQEHERQARGSILPTLTAAADYYQQEHIDNPFATGFQPDVQRTAKLSITQPLFRGLREIAAMKQAKELTEAQKEAKANALLQLYVDVSQAYYTVLANEADRENLRVRIGLYDERIADLRQRVRIGQSNTTEALAVEAAKANAEAQLQQTEGQLLTARANFNFLTGLPADTALLAPKGLERALPRLDTLLARVEETPSVRQARVQKEAASLGVTIAKRAHLPVADLLGNYYFARPEGFFKDVSWDFQVTISLPLYEGGVTESKVREAASVHAQAELGLLRARRQVETEIRAGYALYQKDLEQVRALEAAVQVNEKNYRATRRDYARGLFKNIDVLAALTSFQESHSALDRARYTALIDYNKLRAAAGLLPSAATTGTEK